MGTPKNHSIKNDYATYTNLVDGRKVLTVCPVVVSKIRENQKHYRTGSSSGVHLGLKKSIDFIIEIKISNQSDFKFKLFCEEMYPAPFFRYDSYGATHRNRLEGLPLTFQAVPTPHFHKYNSEGIEIAYQTRMMESLKFAKKIVDIENCIKYFSKEGNLQGPRGAKIPSVSGDLRELPLKVIKEDPLQNVNF